MQCYLQTAPTSEPLALQDVRSSLRIDDDRFDDQLPRLIAQARRIAEHDTGRRLMAQTWRYELDAWPAADEPIPECEPSAVAVSYWNGAAWVTLATNAYVWCPGGAARASILLAPALGTSWPTLGAIALGPRVRIDVTSGAASPEQVLPEAQTFMLAQIGVLLDDPTATDTEALAPSRYLRHLLDPIRLYR